VSSSASISKTPMGRGVFPLPFFLPFAWAAEIGLDWGLVGIERESSVEGGVGKSPLGSDCRVAAFWLGLDWRPKRVLVGGGGL
jgi:hypothetical protein